MENDDKRTSMLARYNELCPPDNGRGQRTRHARIPERGSQTRVYAYMCKNELLVFIDLQCALQAAYQGARPVRPVATSTCDLQMYF